MGNTQPSDARERAEKFLAGLSDLSREHGIGIAGNAVLFVMEPEDFSARYDIDDESNLVRV